MIYVADTLSLKQWITDDLTSDVYNYAQEQSVGALS